MFRVENSPFADVACPYGDGCFTASICPYNHELTRAEKRKKVDKKADKVAKVRSVKSDAMLQIQFDVEHVVGGVPLAFRRKMMRVVATKLYPLYLRQKGADDELAAKRAHQAALYVDSHSKEKKDRHAYKMQTSSLLGQLKEKLQ